MKEKLN